MSTALSMTSPPNPPAPSSGNNFIPLKKPINKGFSPFYCPLWKQNGNLFKYPKSKELTDFHKSVSSFCLSYCIKWFVFFYVNYLQLRIYSCLVKPAPKKCNRKLKSNRYARLGAGYEQHRKSCKRNCKFRIDLHLREAQLWKK